MSESTVSLSQITLPDHFFVRQITSSGILAAIGNKDSETLRVLLSQGHYNINDRDGDGKTYLHHAVKSENIACIKLLLDWRAERSLEDHAGNPPFMETSDEHVHTFLFEYHPHQPGVHGVNAVDGEGLTELMRAARNNEGDAVGRLLKNCDVQLNVQGRFGETALSLAIRARADLDSVIIPLIDMGADVSDFKDQHGYPMILLAETYIWSERLIELMISKGADIDAVDARGFTPLLQALTDHFDINRLTFLIEKCYAKIDIQGPCFRTAMMWAMDHPERQAVVTLLLKNGGSLEEEDAFGFTPLFYAVNNEGCDLPFIKWLIEQKGADPKHKSLEGESITQIAAKSNRDADIIRHLFSYTDDDNQLILDMVREAIRKRLNIFTLEKDMQTGEPDDMDMTDMSNPSSASTPFWTATDLIRRALRKAIKVEGTLTQFDLDARAMCGCAVAVALVSLSKSEKLNINSVLEKGRHEYNRIIFDRRSVNFLNSRERYFYGKHLGWVGDILPHFPELEPLAPEKNTVFETLKKGEEFNIYRRIFEELVKKIPEGENKLIASLLVGALFLGLVVRKDEQQEVYIGIFDPHGISLQGLSLKAYYLDFSVMEEAVEFLALLSSSLFLEDVSMELNPLIFRAEKEGLSPTPPLPEEEQVALLLVETGKQEGLVDGRAFEKLGNDYPSQFKEICLLLDPDRWLNGLIAAHFEFEKPDDLISALILPFLKAYKMDEIELRLQIEKMCTEKYQGRKDAVTFEDLAEVFSQGRINRYSEKTGDLCFCLQATPYEQRLHLLGKYIHGVLRKEQMEKKIGMLAEGIQEMRLALTQDVNGYQTENLFFRSERSENLQREFDIIIEIGKHDSAGFLSQESSSFFKKAKENFLKALNEYFENILVYRNLHKENVFHLSFLEMERPFVEDFKELLEADKKKEIDEIFQFETNEGTG